MFASISRSWKGPLVERTSTVLSKRLGGGLSSSKASTQRWKHSLTQIKRMKNHPARLRAEKRMGIDRTPDPMPPTQYKTFFEPEFLPNGWSAPPGPDVEIPDYPFQVSRTKNKPNGAIGFLPIYSKYRNGGSKVTTQIENVTGDRDAFLQELRSVLQVPPPKNGNPRDDAICIRAGGTIEVKGNRVREVKQWLAGLGF